MTITVTETDWEKTQQRSFYQGAQAVPQLVTTMGQALGQELLQNKGARAPTLEEDDSGGIAKRLRAGIITPSMGRWQWSGIYTKRARGERLAVRWKRSVN